MPAVLPNARSHFDCDEVTCGLRYLGRPGAVGGVPRVVWGQKNMENNSVTLNHYVHTEYASCEQRFHSTVTAVTRDKACTGQVGPTAPDAARDRPDRSPIAPRTRAAGAGAAAARRRRRPFRPGTHAQRLEGPRGPTHTNASSRPPAAATAAPFRPALARALLVGMPPRATCNGRMARARDGSRAGSAGTFLAPAEVTTNCAASAFSGTGAAR